MNMTKKQSIDYLKDLWNEVYNEDSDGYNYAIALDMAIEALQTENKPYKVIAEVKVDIDEIVEHIKEKYVFTNEVVRCKDCRFNKHPLNDLCLIKKAGIYPDDDDFCSYGERKGGEK